MTLERVIKLLRLGSCSVTRRAECGCETCDEVDEAVAYLEGLHADLVRLRAATEEHEVLGPAVSTENPPGEYWIPTEGA